MLSRFLSCAALAGAALLAGCAAPNMAFSDASQRPEALTKPVVLMTATIKNKYHTAFQPRLMMVMLQPDGTTDYKHHLVFRLDDQARMETGNADTGNTYLLRMEVPPGKYEIVSMNSSSVVFPIVSVFVVPMEVPLELKDKGVYYIGHVDATVRERHGNEFRAGPVIPLIDQAASGASGGTFDVQIVDQEAKDEALFRTRFPALNGVTIQKAMLPAFDREKAQKYWETH